jgi:hypothetical protein
MGACVCFDMTKKGMIFFEGLAVGGVSFLFFAVWVGVGIYSVIPGRDHRVFSSESSGCHKR